MKNMTPFKPVTGEQIGRLADKLTARLKKHSNQLPSNHFQEILSDDTLIDEMLASVRKRIEARTGMIRTVKVNRTRSNLEALKATGMYLNIDHSVVNNAPQGKDEEVELVLFKPGHQKSCSDLDKEYDIRELNPADLQEISALNEADQSFAGTHVNGIYLKDKNGNCFLVFFRFGVIVLQDVNGCDASSWLVGVRKVGTQQGTTTLNS